VFFKNENRNFFMTKKFIKIKLFFATKKIKERRNTQNLVFIEEVVPSGIYIRRDSIQSQWVSNEILLTPATFCPPYRLGSPFVHHLIKWCTEFRRSEEKTKRSSPTVVFFQYMQTCIFFQIFFYFYIFFLKK